MDKFQIRDLVLALRVHNIKYYILIVRSNLKKVIIITAVNLRTSCFYGYSPK